MAKSKPTKPSAKSSRASPRTSTSKPVPTIQTLKDPVRVRGGSAAAPARPPPVSVATRPQIKKTLGALSKGYTRAAVAKATGIAPSTLRSWEKNGVPAKSKARAAQAAVNANKRLYVSRAEARRIVRDIQDAQRLGKGAAAQAAGRSTTTLDRYTRELQKKRPTPKVLAKARAAIEKMDKSAKRVSRTTIATRNKEGKIIKRKGTRTEYKAIRPPRVASAYRIYGVDKKGKSVWSTLQGADWETLIKEAEKKRSHYKTSEMRIELIDLIDDYEGQAPLPGFEDDADFDQGDFE